MVKSYKYLENIAIADAAFEAEGSTLSELFEVCAEAVFNVMVDVKTVNPKIEKEVELENEDVERLLFDFLSEILYLKDAESMLFCSSKVNVEGNKLKAVLKGEKIDINKHKLGTDIKAITMHQFKVEKVGDVFKAKVIADI